MLFIRQRREFSVIDWYSPWYYSVNKSSYFHTPTGYQWVYRAIEEVNTVTCFSLLAKTSITMNKRKISAVTDVKRLSIFADSIDRNSKLRPDVRNNHYSVQFLCYPSKTKWILFDYHFPIWKMSLDQHSIISNHKCKCKYFLLLPLSKTDLLILIVSIV